MTAAVTLDQLLRQARYRVATVRAMAARLGCSRYRFYRIRRDDHWISRAVLLEAARRCMADHGQGFQTDLTHFTEGKAA